jgi:hypothetical protein
MSTTTPDGPQHSVAPSGRARPRASRRRNRIFSTLTVSAALTLTACQPEEGGRILLKSPEVDHTEVGFISLPMRDHPVDWAIVVRVPLAGGTNQEVYDPAYVGLCLDLPHAVFRESGVGSPILNGDDKYEVTAADPCLKNGIVLTLHRKHP